MPAESSQTPSKHTKAFSGSVLMHSTSVKEKYILLSERRYPQNIQNMKANLDAFLKTEAALQQRTQRNGLVVSNIGAGDSSGN